MHDMLHDHKLLLVVWAATLRDLFDYGEWNEHWEAAWETMVSTGWRLGVSMPARVEEWGDKLVPRRGA